MKCTVVQTGNLATPGCFCTQKHIGIWDVHLKMCPSEFLVTVQEYFYLHYLEEEGCSSADGASLETGRTRLSYLLCLGLPR